MKISKINGKILVIPLLFVVFAAVFSFHVYTASAAQSTIYVSPSGNDGWSGKNPTWNGTDGPKKSISNAINTAPVGGTVKIAGGIYKEIPGDILG